jgi:anhydro-N-acetylmuramic acid kinase
MLFASGSEWRGLQNLGGIGNITVVPPHGEVEGVRAFDTGPGVVVIDGVTRALRPDLAYDIDGKLAKAGRPNMAIVRELLAAPYFASPPPKSTGRELFNTDYFTKLVARARADGATDEDVIATAVQLTAESVGDAYRRFIAEPMTEVLASGGGAKNPTLFAAIAKAAAPIRVRHFDEVYFDGEAKEAVAFALLGYLHMTSRAGNVPTATGARGQRILGKLTPA